MKDLEVEREFEPGDDTEDRLRRAVAILLGEDRESDKGDAA